jgi:hypothetical protein
LSRDLTGLFDALAAEQPEAAAIDAPISVPALVREWLGRGPAVLTGADRTQLDELCRQIDVRKRISLGYGEGWTRLDPETPAPAAVVGGVVAVLLANAGGVGEPGPGDTLNDGWGLKCINTALKALDLWSAVPQAAELRSVALHRVGSAREVTA